MNQEQTNNNQHQFWKILSIFLLILVFILFYQNHKLKLNQESGNYPKQQGVVPNFDMETYKKYSDIFEPIPGDAILFSEAKILNEVSRIIYFALLDQYTA